MEYNRSTYLGGGGGWRGGARVFYSSDSHIRPGGVRPELYTNERNSGRRAFKNCTVWKQE